jgi:hypothetical protein
VEQMRDFRTMFHSCVDLFILTMNLSLVNSPDSVTPVTKFEIELADLVRRFQNLEALQKESTAKGEGFEARRITVTHSDGQETSLQTLIFAA